MTASGLWRRPGFGRFWTASTVSELGTPITTLAVQVLVVVDLQSSAAALGVVNAARWVPYLLFGLVVGVLVDRAARRLPLLIACDLVRAALLGVVPLLYLLGALNVPAVVAMAALIGLVSVVRDAGHQSVLPRLVPAQLLTVANARLEQAGAVGRTSGPLLAGALVRVLGAPLTLLVAAATFLVSGILVATVRRVEHGRTDRSSAPRHLGHELAEGLRWVYRHTVLAPMAVWVHIWFLFNAMLTTVFVPYALRDLDLGALGLGVSYAASGVGAVLGGAAAGRAARRLGLGWAVVAAHWLTPLAFGLVLVTPPGPVAWVLVGVAQLLFGLFVGLSSPLELGFRQAVTPDRLQGRMNATIRSLNWGMIAIGAPVGGLLADHFGARVALGIGIAGVALASVGLMLSPFRRARAAG